MRAEYRSGVGHLHWEDDGTRLRTPVATVEEVRVLGGSRLEIVVEPHLRRPPSLVYAVDEVSPDAAEAFAEAVRRDMGRRGVHRWRGRAPGWALVAAAVLAVLVAVDVTVAVRGTELPAPLPWAQVFGSLGAPPLVAVGIVYWDEWVLSRRGVTAVAVFAGYTHQTALYEYTDHEGAVHQYRSQRGRDPVLLRYDPRRPSRASAGMRPVERYGLLVPLLVGAGMVGAMLVYTGYGLFVSLTTG